MPETLRIAAVQLAAVVGDVRANLRACEALADQAAASGAEWIVLPEFFPTGMAYDRRLHDLAMPTGGEATQLMHDSARRHGAFVGGSFLCRDDDGEVRNAFMLVSPAGEVVGRHDKDLPTMWENCFYTGGRDAGIFELEDGPAVGAAMCWELIRSQTARRLSGNVDLVIGGSCWWSVPAWPPKTLTSGMERRNELNATRAAARLARLVGAPVAHAAHCGAIECPMPWAPLSYRGRTEGGAAIYDADGHALAFRAAGEGPGVVVADVEIGRRTPAEAPPDDFWLVDRGAVPSLAWRYQRLHGRAEYARFHGLPARGAPVM